MDPQGEREGGWVTGVEDGQQESGGEKGAQRGEGSVVVSLWCGGGACTPLALDVRGGGVTSRTPPQSS